MAVAEVVAVDQVDCVEQECGEPGVFAILSF